MMTEKQIFDEFKVGDDVWCVLYGKGKVVNVRGYGDYPLEVVFPDSIMHGLYLHDGAVDYTHDGKLNIVAQRSLFFSEPIIEGAVTRPFVSKLEGKTVLLTVQPDFSGSYDIVVKVFKEDESKIFTDKALSGYYRKEVISCIREVSSVNLLDN